MKKKLVVLLFPLLASALIILFWPKTSGAFNFVHQCASCHNLHGNPNPTLLGDSDIQVLCLSCHGPSGPYTEAAIHSVSKYVTLDITCVACHDPHDNLGNIEGGTNIKLVGTNLGANRAQIDAPNGVGIREVVFESRGTDAGEPSLHSFADADEDINGYLDGVCETCHTNTTEHNNTRTDPHHDTGRTCTDCHPHGDGFAATGGTCTTCHTSEKPNNRRAVVGEFSLVSHHVAGVITNEDCNVCHAEIFGNTNHMDNAIELKDPDTGSSLATFAQFSRNTNGNSLEATVIDVQNNFCLKCHDSDGAQATRISNPLRPFSVDAGYDVPNVFDRFATSNSNHHAVRGAGNNSYCNVNTMESPWNQSGHDVISCFDCHGIPDGSGIVEAVGHGADNQRMLRTPIDFASMEAGVLSDTLGTNVETFCTICHKASEYVSGGSASIMEYHGTNQSQHGAAGGNQLGCLGCHAGIVDLGGLLGGESNGAARGNIHGGNFTWGSQSYASGTATEHFMLGGYMSGWDIYQKTRKGVTYEYGRCRGGDCNHSNSSKEYLRW